MTNYAQGREQAERGSLAVQLGLQPPPPAPVVAQALVVGRKHPRICCGREQKYALGTLRNQRFAT